MPPTNATEEIIEKKSGSPVATSCLIIAVVALIAGMLLQVMEIGEYRKNPLLATNQPNLGPGQAKAKADIANFQKAVADILEKKAAGGAETNADADKPEEEKPADKPTGADAKAPKATQGKDAKAPDADPVAADPGAADTKDDAKEAPADSSGTAPDAGDAKGGDAKEPAEPAADTGTEKPDEK